MELCSLLSTAGLQGLERKLLQYISCRPVSFTLTQKLSFGEDLMRCSIQAERKGNDYVISFYEASLMRMINMPAQTINQVAVPELEKTMLSIDWNENGIDQPFRLDDESTWVREKTIDQIISDLLRLSATPDGKIYSDILKVRFWSDTVFEQLTGSLAAVRSKLEVTQRFYLVGSGVIGVEEAYRFLMNRWIERKMSNERRTKRSSSEESADGRTTIESKLLKKKRVSNRKKLS